MSLTLIPLKFGNSVANIVSPQSLEGLIKCQYLIIAKNFTPNSSLTLKQRAYSTYANGSSNVDALNLHGNELKKIRKFQRRNSMGSLYPASSEKIVRIPPPIINSLPSRKPLHQSTDIRGVATVGNEGLQNMADLTGQLKKAYEDTLHFCHCM